MVSASGCNVDIVVDSKLSIWSRERNKNRIAALNLQKGITRAPQIINKWIGARKRGEGTLPASIVDRQSGFKVLAGADAFIADLRAESGEQSRPLRIAAVVNVETAVSDL